MCLLQQNIDVHCSDLILANLGDVSNCFILNPVVKFDFGPPIISDNNRFPQIFGAKSAWIAATRVHNSFTQHFHFVWQYLNLRRNSAIHSSNWLTVSDYWQLQIKRHSDFHPAMPSKLFGPVKSLVNVLTCQDNWGWLKMTLGWLIATSIHFAGLRTYGSAHCKYGSVVQTLFNIRIANN